VPAVPLTPGKSDSPAAPLTQRVCPQCHAVFHEAGVFCPHDRTPLLPFRPDDARCGTLMDGRFLVLARLGRGGMGTVYRAWQLSTAREVALKLLADAVKDEPVALERFLREARVTASLRCPHTVRVFDYGQLADQTPYLAMELVEGVTLDALLASTGALPPPRAIELVRQICLALEEAHGLGLVHRDLKPSNIMVSPVADGGDFARVLDFGVVKALDDDDTALTAENAHPGTPAYMAPEQARSEPVGPPADLYAVAVMLYEMLTGERPFTGTSAVAVLVQHAHTPPPRLVERCPSLPGVAALDAVLQRGLAKRPAERYGDAATLRGDLDRLRSGQSPQAAFALAATAEAPAKKRMLGLNFQALGCSVQLAIAVGALALFILPTWRDVDEAPPPSDLEAAVVHAEAPPLEDVVKPKASQVAAPASMAPKAPESVMPGMPQVGFAAGRGDPERDRALETGVAPGSLQVPDDVRALEVDEAPPEPNIQPPPEPKPALKADPPSPRPGPKDSRPLPPPAVQPIGSPTVQPIGSIGSAAPVEDEEKTPGDADLAKGDPLRGNDADDGATAGDQPEPPQADPPRPPNDPRLEALRTHLRAACGAGLKGTFRVVIAADGTTRLADPGAPACVVQAVGRWVAGAPAATLEVTFP
jgi:hypothetical protein